MTFLEKMNKSILTMSVAGIAALALTACGGGGGGNPNADVGGSNLTQSQHDALTKAFITEATNEGLGFTLVKENTQQAGYIVVRESNGTLDAFYVDAYTPGSSVAAFAPDYTSLTDYSNGLYATTATIQESEQVWVDTSYYDYYGNYVSDGYYETDYYNQDVTVTFSVDQPTSKDLQKVAAFKQSYAINSSAKKVQQKFGLSLERATEVAKLALQVKAMPKMSSNDYDSLSQQLLGVPASKLDSAMTKTANGDKSASADVDDIISAAAATNGVGPEQARALLNTLTSAK